MTATTERLTVCGIALETLRCGSGTPLVALHGMQTIDPAARFLELLSRRTEVIAPTHPGFGDSARPESCETVYDLVHLYLGLLDSLPYDKVTLIGFSFGGWLAAEIAAASCHRINRLILVAPFGIKLGDRETRDITDVFNTHPEEVRRREWHDPERYAPDYNAMEDAALIRRARSWDALCLYGWHPYMYNPRLKHWLRNISVPTQLLWGASDYIVTPDYGRGYAALIRNARFTTIADAGHHPEIEQPDVFAAHVLGFIG